MLTRQSEGFSLLLIVLGILGIGVTAFLVGLGAGIARAEQRIARGADQDYLQRQIEMVLSGCLVPGVPEILAKTNVVDARQMGLL